MCLLLRVKHSATRGHKILVSFQPASFLQWDSEIWVMEQGPDAKKKALWCVTLKRSGI